MFSKLTNFTFKFITLLSISIHQTNSKFIYRDFNDTTGLYFVGDSATTNCWDNPLTEYGDVERKADYVYPLQVSDRKETTNFIFETHLDTTSNDLESKVIDQKVAGFRHRSDTRISPNKCIQRARLTPSAPSQRGGMWYRDNVPITNGFDTYFTFQISDHSKECVFVKDQYLSSNSYETCNIHGGDGFAFVVHNYINETNTLGDTGGQIGFGGIPNSLAISFDTWENPNLGQNLIGVDNISIHSRGVDNNDAYQAGLLGTPKTHPLADGQIHLVRIVYFNSLQPKYFDKLVASPSLLQFLKDNGEQKRLGTLAIFIDDGVANDVPLMVLPINLSVLLSVPRDTAYVGFVSATGKYYEKHDILSWIWCESVPCETPDISKFDYHQHSKFSTTNIRSNVPGYGYGGNNDENKYFPITNTNPDTTTVAEKKEYFAEKGLLDGLTNDLNSQFQVPPYTDY